jgi:hypothetical protein
MFTPRPIVGLSGLRIKYREGSKEFGATVFNTPTVLIVSAGASAEFNMPLGFQLIQRVAETAGINWLLDPEKGSLLASGRNRG